MCKNFFTKKKFPSDSIGHSKNVDISSCLYLCLFTCVQLNRRLSTLACCTRCCQTLTVLLLHFAYFLENMNWLSFCHKRLLFRQTQTPTCFCLPYWTTVSDNPALSLSHPALSPVAITAHRRSVYMYNTLLFVSLHSSQALETVGSLNNTTFLFLTGLGATEHTSVSEPNNLISW